MDAPRELFRRPALGRGERVLKIVHPVAVVPRVCETLLYVSYPLPQCRATHHSCCASVPRMTTTIVSRPWCIMVITRGVVLCVHDEAWDTHVILLVWEEGNKEYGGLSASFLTGSA